MFRWIKRDEKGAVTVAELMVALAIGSIVISAALAFLVQGTDIFNFSDDQIAAQQEARIATQNLIKDIRGASLITVYQYRIEITGVTVKGENVNNDQLNHTPISANAEPILYNNGTPIAPSNYIIHSDGLINWNASRPSGTITADYTYDGNVTYSISNSTDADLSKNGDTIAHNIINLREIHLPPSSLLTTGA